MKCRVCGYNTNVIENLVNIPFQVSVLYNEPTTYQSCNLDLFACPNCSHFQISDINKSDYYSDYFMASKMNMSLIKARESACSFLASIAKDRTSFLDIGCGPGYMMEIAQKSFNNIVGVEPSKVAAQIARDKGLFVLDEFFTASLFPEQKFDAFCLMQVLEHVEEPVQILKDTFEILSIGGVGLLEVPNGLKIIRSGSYHSVFSDHLNYYTPLSLSQVAFKAGFDVLHVKESLNGDHLEVYVRKPDTSIKINDLRKQQTQFLDNITEKYNNIGIWGAGAKAFSFLNQLQSKTKIKHFFDADPCKHGFFIPGTDNPISAPSEKAIAECDAIIIFALSYKDEITECLRKEYKYNGQIIIAE